MNSDLARHLNEFLSVLTKYAKTKLDLLKLSVIDKSSGFTSLIFSLLFAVLVAALVVGFAAAAFAVWYGDKFGSYSNGLLIAAGALILSFVFFFIGRRLLVSLVIKNFSEILFDDDEKQEI